MPVPVILDVVLVILIALFALSGVRRGFVLTLCSLVALVFALVCGNLSSAMLAPKVAEHLEPRWEAEIELRLEQSLSENISAQESLEALREKGGLYAWTADRMEQALNRGTAQTAAQLAASVAAELAELVARCVIFLVTFLLVSLAWTVLARVLNLFTHLPGLSLVNKVLGLVLGGAKGLVVAYLLIWIACSLTGLIPEQTVDQTHLLLFLHSHSPLELLMLTGSLLPGTASVSAGTML